MATIRVPGRTELAGNHTDHQNGRTLASAIHLNIQAEYAENADETIRIHSRNVDPIVIRTNQLSVRPAEFGKPVSLVRASCRPFMSLA